MKRILLGLTALSLAGCNYGMQHQGYQYGGGHSYHSSYGNGYHAPVQHQRLRHAPRTGLEFSAGAEEFTGGNIVTQIVGTGSQVNKIQYKDAYDTAWRGTAGITHDVAPKTTLIARGFYKDAQSSDDPLTFSTGNTGRTITGNFSDHKSYGAEVGFREYLNHGNAQLRPYIGATVGAAYMEAIDFENGVASTGTAFPTPIEVYEKEWVPTASAVVGLDVPVMRGFSMGVESGLRYEGKRDSNLPQFNTTETYSVPLTLRGRFSF